MPRFRFPVNIATTAVALVVGATSATAATHLVLATDTHPATTSAEAPPAGTPGGGNHDGPPHTSTTIRRQRTTEPHPTTTAPPSATVTSAAPHHEPPHPYPYPTTSTTARPTDHHEPGPTTSTTRPPEGTRYPTTSTTAKPTTSTTRPPTDTTVQTLSFGCATGMPDGKPTASCRWSKTTAPGFHHYRLTREVVGTPRQEIFTTTDHDVTGYVDHDLRVGANYSYIIEAYDADGRLIAHSAPFHFTCCEGASTTA